MHAYGMHSYIFFDFISYIFLPTFHGILFTSKKNYIILSDLCNHAFVMNKSSYKFFADKCRLPYYGGCEFTRECISTEFDQTCGLCLPGLTPDFSGDPAFGPCIRKY